MNECVFCDIIAGASRATFVGTNRGAVAFIPLHPVTEGHVLVVPRRHAESLLDPAWLEVDLPRLWTLIRQVGERVMRNADGFNIVQSNGVAATQTVPHVHFHVVPRRDGDGLRLPWSRS